ncbi:MAG: hypothetical protein KDE53_29375, partial [Caldilineaceae bacterium]|nr:hypothetical protein [Caldilineaceae bacterium]
ANVTTPAKFVEFHAYYDGYDEDNDGVSKDWHNLGRNNFHPGGREEQPTGGTINHIGTLLTPAPGRYTMAWRLPHVINQSGVRFKIRLVDAAGNVQDAAGGISAPFDITRSATVVSYNNPNFDDAVLHHNGEYPDTYATTVSLGANPADFDTAYLIGAFWQNPNISLNGNRTLKAFEDGEDDWALSIRTVTLNWLQSNNNTITYSYTRGFGQFIEKPGPTIVLKQNTVVNDTTPPQLSAVSPAADASSAEPRTAIVLQVADSGLGVDINTLAMRVDGNSVQPEISGAPDAFTLTYTPTVPLPFDTTVTVAVDGCDYAAQCISGASYTFTVRSPLLVTNVVGSGVITRTPALASYPVGTPVTVTATADPGWTFASWSGTSSGTAPSLGLVLDQDHVITATFAQDQYQIITATDGNGSGSVNVEPAQPTYLYGDVITLTATADPGATFAGWTGAVVGAANPVTLTVTGNQAVTATFTANEYALDLTVTGTGTGGVDVAPAQTTYRYNTALTLTATAAPGSTFAGWSGDRTASEPQLNLTITDHLHLTAAFTLDYYTLTVKITDDNDQPAPENRVTVTPAANAAGYVYGEVATLTAVPAPGWLFQGWRDAVEGNQPSTTLTVEGDATVTAVFVPIYYTLTVEAVDDTDAPTTNGAVLISPPQNAAGYRY